MTAAITLRTAAIAVVTALTLFSPPAEAASPRTEAEAIPHAGGCWIPHTWAALSGGGGRLCGAERAPLSFSVDVPAGSPGVLKLYGYRDSIRRGFRVRVDGGAWTAGYLQGTSAPSVPFHTTRPLHRGSHRVQLEWINSDGPFTFDHASLEASTAPGITGRLTAPIFPRAGSKPGICAITPADGQTAIQAAIEECPNGSTIKFPAGGSYNLTDSIVVRDRSDLVIDGNGSTFTTTTPNDSPALGQGAFQPNWLLLRATRVVLKNMTIVGNFKDPPPRRVIPGNQFNAGVIIAGGNTVTASDLVVKDVWGETVLTTKSGAIESGDARAGQTPTNIRIKRLRGTKAARQCVAFSAAEGAWLEDSVLDDCWQTGVDLEVDVSGVPLHNVHVLRNTVSNFFLSAFAIPYYGAAGDVRDIEIRGNKTLTAQDTCWPVVQTKDTANGRDGGQTAQNIVVEDNQLKSNSHGIHFRDVLSGAIRNNRIKAVRPVSHCGWTPFARIVRERSTNVRVSGNTLGY